MIGERAAALLVNLPADRRGAVERFAAGAADRAEARARLLHADGPETAVQLAEYAAAYLLVAERLAEAAAFLREAEGHPAIPPPPPPAPAPVKRKRGRPRKNPADKPRSSAKAMRLPPPLPVPPKVQGDELVGHVVPRLDQLGAPVVVVD